MAPENIGQKIFSASSKTGGDFFLGRLSPPEAPRVPPNPYARCTATRFVTVNPPHSAIPLGVTRAASGTERVTGQRPSSCAAPASLLAHPAGNRSIRRERDAFRQKPGESLGEAASRARRTAGARDARPVRVTRRQMQARQGRRYPADAVSRRRWRMQGAGGQAAASGCGTTSPMKDEGRAAEHDQGDMRGLFRRRSGAERFRPRRAVQDSPPRLT